jgi:hypothetical protein
MARGGHPLEKAGLQQELQELSLWKKTVNEFPEKQVGNSIVLGR